MKEIAVLSSTLRVPRRSSVHTAASHLLHKARSDVCRQLASTFVEVNPLSIPALDSEAAEYSLLQRKCNLGRSDSANEPSGSRRISRQSCHLALGLMSDISLTFGMLSYSSVRLTVVSCTFSFLVVFVWSSLRGFVIAVELTGSV
jgi:hypothetical protein